MYSSLREVGAAAIAGVGAADITGGGSATSDCCMVRDLRESDVPAAANAGAGAGAADRAGGSAYFDRSMLPELGDPQMLVLKRCAERDLEEMFGLRFGKEF